MKTFCAFYSEETQKTYQAFGMLPNDKRKFVIMLEGDYQVIEGVIPSDVEYPRWILANDHEEAKQIAANMFPFTISDLVITIQMGE